MKINNCHLCGFDKLMPIIKTTWSIKRCLNCGLVQVNPQPDENQVLQFYQGDISGNYQPYLSQIDVHRQYFDSFIQKMIKIKPKAKLLDVGCALGPLLEVAEKYGYQAEGTDLSEYAINYCHKIGLTAIKGGINKIDKVNYYDIITAFDTIEHEREPFIMVNKTYQLLKSKGVAVFTTPNFNSLGRKILGKFWPGYRHVEHLFFFTPQTLIFLFKKAGFVNIKVTTDPMRPYPIGYWFRRLSDYFSYPIIKDIFIFLSKLTGKMKFIFPFNPWGNIMIYAEKN